MNTQTDNKQQSNSKPSQTHSPRRRGSQEDSIVAWGHTQQPSANTTTRSPSE